MWGAEGMQMPGWQGNDGNAAYLDKTLRHHPIELSLDDGVSGMEIFRLWVRATLVSFVVLAFFVLIAGLAAVSEAIGGNSSADSYDGSGGGNYSFAEGTFQAGGWISTVVFFVVLLFVKRREPIGEWRVLLADSADRTDSAYSQIAGTVRNRQIPVQIAYRRIDTGLGRDRINNRLVLSSEGYNAYISVFPYGTSLYLGWMMWRTRLGIRLMIQFVSDGISTLLRRNDLESRVLRTETARAMREAVHAACREGLHAALDGRTVSTDFGFPEGLPPIDEARVPVAQSGPSSRFGPAQNPAHQPAGPGWPPVPVPQPAPSAPGNPSYPPGQPFPQGQP
ncbi:hypothetical protein, partial [Frankia sp. AgB32]|uniref:hypothetical protein n=1 Tax=Frankia sp. AgB32 TaxID=631119 RepID=UPI0034D486A9|nr:hypothetical protein [Frankia sp. AgB32]